MFFIVKTFRRENLYLIQGFVWIGNMDIEKKGESFETR